MKHLQHEDIWHAIDRLAEQCGLSVSALAKGAGLDPTTFNKSKRQSKDGKQRWPTTESISKILEFTGIGLNTFVSFMYDRPMDMASVQIPLIGSAQAGREGFFDDAGFPVGGSWDEIEIPALRDEKAYALQINGESMEPAYREGDIIVVSPGARVRRGDRVVVKTVSGEVMAKQLIRQTAHRVELASLNPEFEDITLMTTEVDWMSRIVWVSQ